MEKHVPHFLPEDITSEQENGVVSFSFPDATDLNYEAAPVLKGVLEAALSRPDTTAVVLDMSDVIFIDSANLGSLVACYKLSKQLGKDLVIDNSRASNTKIDKAFAITGLDKVFKYKPSEKT